MAQFCIKVYFPSWFDIKRNATISEGSVNYFNMITKIATFPQKTVKSIGLDTLQRNPENVLLSMLSDTNSDVKKAAVRRIQCLRAIMEPANQPKINVQKSQDKNYSSDTIATPNIRNFLLPQVNFQARSYHEMTNINTPNITGPPLLRLFSDQEIEDITKSPLKLHHPCHNHAVERHIKVVSEASLSVCEFEKRDGVIRQTLCSGKLMKCYDTKEQFEC